MADADLQLIRRLRGAGISREELLELFESRRDNLRVLLQLVQHPLFPQDKSLTLVSRFNAFELLQVVRNKAANPFVRKRCEVEITVRFKRMALGEKISLLKKAPASLLRWFIAENDPRLLRVILASQVCTEDIVLEMINHYGDRGALYRELASTHWCLRPGVARAVLHDLEAPLIVLLAVIAGLPREDLRRIAADDSFHSRVREAAVQRLELDVPHA